MRSNSEVSHLIEQHVKVELTDPESREAQQLLDRLSQTLQHITGSSGAASFDVNDVKVEGACFAIGRLAGGIPVACDHRKSPTDGEP